MMKHKIITKLAVLSTGLIVSFVSSISIAGPTVVANDTQYKVLETKQAHFIYAPQLEQELKQSQKKAQEIQAKYQASFGYQMDEALTIGLLSEKNQIANGFSSPSPFNMQINYLGGTQAIDYFSSSSWLDALLYHETAHNYQMNPKNNSVSCFMKQTMGNNAFPVFLGIVPFFTFPNVSLPTVLIEGNAVLNESWHGNGGRLYSGRAYALFLSQLKAGKIDPSRLINSHLDFPYGEEKYLIGGFFWLYLSEIYGLDKTNQFYLSNSQHFINPFQTNKSFIQHFGLSFEQAVANFTQHHQANAQRFNQLKGEPLATTQYFSFMNRTQDEVLFVSNDGKSDPILHRINRQQQLEQRIPGHWLSGKPFIYQGQAVTAASHINSPEKIVQGLFDQDGLLIPGSGSKMLQSNNQQQALWFDVPNSFSSAKLMQGNAQLAQGQLVDTVNSSALIGEQDEIYYFKQEGKTRTLYRDQSPLFSFKGYYGIVVDSDQQGRVYFIAATKYGSSLFAWQQNKIVRLSSADNIIDAKILSHSAQSKQINWLVASIEAENIKYLSLITKQAQAIPSIPYEPIFGFEHHQQGPLKQTPIQTRPEDCSTGETFESQTRSKDYSLFSQTRFSAFTPYLGYSSNYGTTFNFQLDFTDPLKQNKLQLFASHESNGDYLAGLNYANSRNRLEYGGGFYGIAREVEQTGGRSYGSKLFAQYKLLQQGFHLAQTKLQFIADDAYADKNLSSLSLDYAYQYQQALRLYPNQAHYLSGFAKLDRGDQFLGAKARLFRALPYDFFVGIDGKYVDSTTDNLTAARGIRFSNKRFNPNGDPSDFEMAALDNSFYAKTGWQIGGSLKKQFDYSLYFFTFPFSLRREAFYISSHHYEANSNATYQFNESIAGMSLELLLLNKYPFPLGFELIHNDNTLDKLSYRITLELLNF